MDKGQIVQSSGPAYYLVELTDGRTWRLHINHLRKAEGSERSKVEDE